MRTLPGLNIQFPISKLIHNGSKTVETRTYPIPNKYVGQDLYLIETPGAEGDFSARIIGIIRFGESFEYKSAKEFYADISRHFVDEKSLYKWTKTKWGWPILNYQPLDNSIPAPRKRGIKFTSQITI